MKNHSIIKRLSHVLASVLLCCTALTAPTTAFSEVELNGAADAPAGLLPLIPEVSEDGYIYLEWDSLMPANYNGDPNDSSGSIKLVDELIGKKISIPGFIVPLDGNGQVVYKFLFVPYMGACIHVPPPPPNQLIYADMEEGLILEEMWVPMEIFGTLGAEYVETEIGAAGYTMQIDKVRLFEY